MCTFQPGHFTGWGREGVNSLVEERKEKEKKKKKGDLMLYLWWSLCTLYLQAGQVRVTVGDSGLCCCPCMTFFER